MEDIDIDKDILISKVFKKSVIWDRKLKGHANRSVVDKAWKEVAAEMGVEDDAFLRKKWKYLRDQFSIEIGKVSPSAAGDPIGNPGPKWPYFKSLIFLAGIVKPRTTSSNLKSSKTQATLHQDSEPIEMVAQTKIEPTEMVQTEEIQAPEANPEIQLGETFSLQRKRKWNDVNTTHNQQTTQLENEKTSLRSEDNGDALFFRSLLPYVNGIPYHLKLRFRNKVLQLVEEFAYPSMQDIPSRYSPSYSYGGPSSNSSEQINQISLHDEL